MVKNTVKASCNQRVCCHS